MALADLSENVVEEMIEVVEADGKNRFKMIELDGELLIRCNQGHSLPIVNNALLMDQITDPAEVPHKLTLVKVTAAGGLQPRTLLHSLLCAMLCDM